MAEFVDGFDFLAELEDSVSIFGSARTQPDNPYYQKARELASRLGGEGFSIITGGGPGIMEAANEGAKAAKVDSIGLNIQLPEEQRVNPFVTKSIAFEHFYTRKVMLSFSSRAYVFFPGGYGTLDEMFEMVTLIQTDKLVDDVPVILFGSDYWQPLCDFLEKIVLNKFQAISPEDMDIWTLTDDIDEAVGIVKKSLKQRSHIIDAQK
jgi:uncharacterized protein (TIGR00730 family)